MRPHRLVLFLLLCAATIAAADLARNGFRIERLADKDEALVKPTCSTLESFNADSVMPHVFSCYPGSWAAWIKTQKWTGVPASQRRAIDGCNMEGPARIYIVFPDGAKYVVWHVWEKYTENRAFWLVDAAGRDVNAIWVKEDAPPQYFGKRAGVLRQGKVGEWLNELRSGMTF
jgi:hypothetical protein